MRWTAWIADAVGLLLLSSVGPWLISGCVRETTGDRSRTRRRNDSPVAHTPYSSPPQPARCSSRYLLQEALEWAPPIWGGPLDLLWNLALVVAFGAVHSVTAQPPFYASLEALGLPKSCIRPVYVAVASFTLSSVVLLWHPLGGVVWELPVPASVDRWVVDSLLTLPGVALATMTVLQHGGLDFVGFSFGSTIVDVPVSPTPRPATASTSSSSDPSSPKPRMLLTGGWYGVVRHPIYLGLLLALVSATRLTQDRACFILGTLLYLFAFGIAMEERKLLVEFGPSYRAYQRRVPAAVPVLEPLVWKLCGRGGTDDAEEDGPRAAAQATKEEKKDKASSAAPARGSKRD